MEVTRTEDKNGHTAITVRGTTTDVTAGTYLEIHLGGRVFNGGLLNGQYEYHCTLPDIPFTTVEVWTGQKHGSILVDSWLSPVEDEVVEEELPKSRKKVV